MFFAKPPLHNPKAAPSWVLVFTAVAVPPLGMAFGPAKSLAVQFDTEVPAAIVLETVSPIVAAHADNRNGNGESEMGLATQGSHRSLESGGPAHVDDPVRGLVAGGCMLCVNEPEIGMHYTTWPGSPFSAWGPGDGDHFTMNSGSCGMVHGPCVYVGMDLNPKELTEDVAEAVAMADIATLAELVILAPVRMFAERNAIQILDCDGETIAGHVPVASGLMQSLQTAVKLAEDAQQ